jgi:hypothetical protein
VDEGDVAEGSHGGVAGFLGAHASCDVFGDLLIEVKLDFIVELLRGPAAAEQGLEAQPQSLSPQHAL